MKKSVGFLLLLLVLCVSGCICAYAETTTLLVYMCGGDLQDAGCEDLVEMAEAETGEDVQIVVLAGGAEAWDLEELKGNSRTLAVIGDGDFERLEDWGHQSMGSKESLAEFLIYGFTEYPADRMMVVLWNHGAGSGGGVCFDETADDDGLTIVEINEALEDLRAKIPDFHINIFGCDACMMATYEMSAMLSRHRIDYYIASEEMEPGIGWYYTDWLETLKKDPSISDEALCGRIIDSFLKEGMKSSPDEYMTLSAVKLSEMDALKNSMEQFASVMSGQLGRGNLSSVRRGRSRMYAFGSFTDSSRDMVDLGALLDAYAQFDARKAAEAKRGLLKAVIAKGQTDNLNACSGLSILLPRDTAEEFDDYRSGLHLTNVIPNWIDFLNGYVRALQGGSHHFSASAPGQLSQDKLRTEAAASSFGSAFNWMNWNKETESYQEGKPPEEEILIREGTQGFTATLPQEDLAYLDNVEGLLLMDLSDSEMECYVDFGTMRNNLVDWQSGTVVSLYDGAWPAMGGQPVPLYSQTGNANSRRSLIPVKLNGADTYLVVVFSADEAEGRIIGANAGYDANGLPIRRVTRLKAGDKIVPVYTMYYRKNGEADLQEAEYEGDSIIWEDGMTVRYESPGNETEKTNMLFCFVFNDIFGEHTMSEMISFEL